MIIRQSYLENIVLKTILITIQMVLLPIIGVYSLVLLPIIGYLFFVNYMTVVKVEEDHISYEPFSLFKKQYFNVIKNEKITDVNQVEVSILDRLTGVKEIEVKSIDGTGYDGIETVILKDFDMELFEYLKEISLENKNRR